MKSLQFSVISKFNCAHLIEEISKLHKTSYKTSHLTSTLSVDMLVEYYTAIYHHSDLCVVAKQNDKILGYIFSGYKTSVGVQEFSRKNKFFLFKTICQHPQHIVQKLKIKLLSIFRSKHQTLYPFRLLSIAVHPDCQGEGVSSKLLSFFETQLVNLGVSSYGLSVKRTNVRAIKFYQKTGFQVEAEIDQALYFGKALSKQKPVFD